MKPPPSIGKLLWEEAEEGVVELKLENSRLGETAMSIAERSYGEENRRLRIALERGIELVAESAPLAWIHIDTSSPKWSEFEAHASGWEKAAETWLEIAKQALKEGE